MKTIPEPPDSKEVHDILGKIDAADREIERLQKLAEEKKREEQSLLETGSIDDPETFEAISRARTMQDMVPRKIGQIEILKQDLNRSAASIADNFGIALLGLYSALRNPLVEAMRARLQEALPPGVVGISDLSPLIESLFEPSFLGTEARTLYYGALDRSSAQAEPVRTCRNLLTSAERIRSVLPQFESAFKVLELPAGANRLGAEDSRSGSRKPTKTRD